VSDGREGAPRRPDPLLSVVIPVYNESQVLPLLMPRLLEALGRLRGPWEVLFVNDGSDDRSLELLAEQALRHPRLKVLDLSRNFGHSAAITAGLDHAGGQAVVVMDGDLQDPPELIPDMVELYCRGFDVVHARRSARHDEGLLKRATARLFYRLMGALSERAPVPDVGEFRLMSDEVVRAVRRLREHHRLVRGLVAWVGFRQTTLDFERPGRAAGTTKYSPAKMIRLAWDGVTSFSAAPLRLATLLGLAAMLAGLGYAAFATYVGYVLGRGVPGWTSLIIVNIFFSAVVLICLGLMGEYVARVYEEVKARPLYFVRREIGGADPDGQPPPGGEGRRPG
jgi:polyisoprenyl-phosphate glycosyltransferase